MRDDERRDEDLLIGTDLATIEREPQLREEERQRLEAAERLVRRDPGDPKDRLPLPEADLLFEQVTRRQARG